MKKILFVMWLVMPIISLAQSTSQEIFRKFENWNQVLEAAAREHKPIFIDVYATWCGPCKKMDAEVFPLPAVAGLLGSKYVAVKIQMDRTARDSKEIISWYPDAENLAKQYPIDAYPTYIVLSETGDLVQMIKGYQEPGPLVAVLRSALSGEKSFTAMLKRFNTGTLSFEKQGPLALMAKEYKKDSLAFPIAKSYKQNYFDKTTLSEIENIDILKFIISFPELFSVNDPIIKLCYTDPQSADAVLKEKGFSSTLTTYYVTRDVAGPIIDAARKSSSVPNWKSVESTISTRYDKKLAKGIVFDQKLQWFNEQKDWENVIKLEVARIEEHGLDTAGIGKAKLNNMVYNVIFQHAKQARYLKKGLEYMEVLIKTNPERDTWLDTYANLLYKVGKKDKAMAYQQKAIQIAKKKNDTNSQKEYEATLNNMQNGVPTWQNN